MQYIHRPGDDSIMFDRYQNYILPLKQRIPEEFRDIATESRFYDLSSPESLHDARIRGLRICETKAIPETGEASQTTVHIELRGACRMIFLEYVGVTEYCIRGPAPESPTYFDSHHGDLFTHEFRVEQEGRFTHEIAFVTGASITISFTSLRHWSKE